MFSQRGSLGGRRRTRLVAEGRTAARVHLRRFSRLVEDVFDHLFARRETRRRSRSKVVVDLRSRLSGSAVPVGTPARGQLVEVFSGLEDAARRRQDGRRIFRRRERDGSPSRQDCRTPQHAAGHPDERRRKICDHLRPGRKD